VQHCGIDLHSKATVFHTIDGSGKTVETGSFPTTAEELSAFCRRQSRLTQLYLEAGTASSWAARLIEASGQRAMVIDPNRNRMIAGSVKKTDRSDAATLAAMGRAGLLVAVHVRREGTDRVRQTLTARHALVRARANLVRVVRALHRSDGELLPKAETDDFAELMKGKWGIDPEKADAVVPLVEAIDGITTQVLEAEKTIDGHVKDNRAIVARLTSIPGVGELTAVAFAAHIEDPARFVNTGQIAGYLGLAPWVHESAGKRKDGKITKRGNKAVRALLVQAAWAHLRSKEDTALKRWTLRLMERVGKKKAVTALARKLAELMWTLWRKQTTYTGFPPSSRRTPTPP
jgi:transposase